ncbi:tRNA (adenosine(37)-N6)-dimethylallyltransferase MiaA [Pikeienuella piscinae]|uniref:tRNA dimethylallyltransferase n=1 Tax=Pikeienuella piscinae TaxID=2748098 RepID=A0A7L5BUF3_9RHOB|nr:tRNA (adenosine(37)-N6)-dimethylallyltransferase MiaA [Pikeienuella piscinae]QIE55242.1 tRNA (adenosine(37)-N6)-dimethylallyltransferase MiaA [Pikeienuella piscinae]
MRPLLIAGPTGAGKSAFALKAAAEGGVVVNADASQVYAGWRILTARPSAADEGLAPHRLYGHVDPARRYSVGDWLRDLALTLTEAREAGLRPVIVGGTGLYFAAATQGLAPIPQVPETVRAGVAARLTAEGLAALAHELTARDPETAATADLQNPMRVARALEVLEATGRGLASWREETGPPLIGDADRMLILPERGALYARLDRRFDAMLAEGVLEEARAMRARRLNPALPAMKAVGAPALFAHLDGEIGLDEAAERARRATRNYAKRQMTWARSRMNDWPKAESG